MSPVRRQRVNDVGDRCWLRMLETKFGGDKILMTDYDNDQSRQDHESATKILNQSPPKSHQHTVVTNIAVTSLLVFVLYVYFL